MKHLFLILFFPLSYASAQCTGEILLPKKNAMTRYEIRKPKVAATEFLNLMNSAIELNKKISKIDPAFEELNFTPFCFNGNLNSASEEQIHSDLSTIAPLNFWGKIATLPDPALFLKEVLKTSTDEEHLFPKSLNQDLDTLISQFRKYAQNNPKVKLIPFVYKKNVDETGFKNYSLILLNTTTGFGLSIEGNPLEYLFTTESDNGF